MTIRKVLKRADGATDIWYSDGLQTRTRDGVIAILRSVGISAAPGTAWGYEAAWLYERLSPEELDEIVEGEGDAVAAFREQVAAGMMVEAAIAAVLASYGINVAELVTREPVREWPPEGWE